MVFSYPGDETGQRRCTHFLISAAPLFFLEYVLLQLTILINSTLLKQSPWLGGPPVRCILSLCASPAILRCCSQLLLLLLALATTLNCCVAGPYLPSSHDPDYHHTVPPSTPIALLRHNQLQESNQHTQVLPVGSTETTRLNIGQ